METGLDKQSNKILKLILSQILKLLKLIKLTGILSIFSNVFVLGLKECNILFFNSFFFYYRYLSSHVEEGF